MLHRARRASSPAALPRAVHFRLWAQACRLPARGCEYAVLLWAGGLKKYPTLSCPFASVGLSTTMLLEKMIRMELRAYSSFFRTLATRCTVVPPTPLPPFFRVNTYSYSKRSSLRLCAKFLLFRFQLYVRRDATSLGNVRAPHTPVNHGAPRERADQGPFGINRKIHCLTSSALTSFWLV